MKGPSATKKISKSENKIELRQPPVAFAFECNEIGKEKFLKFMGHEHAFEDNQFFLVPLEADSDKIALLESAFLRLSIRHMSIDKFIFVLKELGVSEASAEEVRSKIEAGRPSIKISFDKRIDNPDGRAELHVSGAAAAKQTDGEMPKGEHSARIRRERLGTAAVEAENDVMPASYEQAKAIVPGLRKWVEVKREAGLTSRREGFDQEVYNLLLKHLRDEQGGLAKWAVSAAGLPRSVLRRIDSGLLQELYHLGNPELPEDIRLPHGQRTGRPVGSVDAEKRASRPEQEPRVPTPSIDQLREAWRIVNRAQRRGVKLT